MNSEETNHIRKIALLVSCASALQIAESLIPHPIPGVRLGLANMIALIAIHKFGSIAAIEVTILRTIMSSFILGTFLSPSFILSFSGALISTLVMCVFHRLLTTSHRLQLSLIGISLLGAFTHNIVQIFIVYLLLIKHKGIFLILPLLGFSAVITGWITGLIALRVCQKLESLPEDNFLSWALSQNCRQANVKEVQLNYKLHFLSPSVKIFSAFMLSLVILFPPTFISKFLMYILLLFLLLFVSCLLRVSFYRLFSNVKELWLFIFFSFFIPVVFNRTGEILLNMELLKITHDGLTAGSMFAARIVLLILTASLLTLTTSPAELAIGIEKILSPLTLLGISINRISKLMALSLTSIPVFLEKAKSFIHAQKLKGIKLKELISILSNLVFVLLHSEGQQK